MTIHRPDLSPRELADAREAWGIVRDGQPVPNQYRAAARKVAAYCFACGYDHDDVAAARPVFIHPDGSREGVPGVFGTNQMWTSTELAEWVAATTRVVRLKGAGPMFSPGHSLLGDRPVGARGPLPAHQRGDARCRVIGWLLWDADGVGPWHDVLGAVGAHGGAYVRARSSNHCPRGCERHPGGAIKWHLGIPLRVPWETTGSLNRDRAEWKGELYAAARFAFQLVADLTGRGFDRQLDQFLCRMYVGAPTDSVHACVSREIQAREGIGFDVRACWRGLQELGVVSAAQVQASRIAATLPPGTAWDTVDGEPPMVAAFKVAGLYVRPMASGNHAVVCPFEAKHSGGKAGDTSTILFANGKVHCSHSHDEGKAAGGKGMREVLEALPPAAQAAHAQAWARARTLERPTPARRGGP